MLPDRGLVAANTLLRAFGTDLVAIVLLENKNERLLENALAESNATGNDERSRCQAHSRQFLVSYSKQSVGALFLNIAMSSLCQICSREPKKYRCPSCGIFR
jgi:hypothetical protein